MLFNSISFLIFFIIFYIFYSVLNYRKQNLLLLAAGTVFYSWWNWKMSFLLGATILGNYYVGQRLYISEKRKKTFVTAVVLNLSVLFVYKYAVFSIQSWNDLLSFLGKNGGKIAVPEILLPVGISFYTFHNISYIADVYFRKIKPAENLLTYAVYDLFFPLLLSGPIERAEKLVPQIESSRHLSEKKTLSGILLFSYGLMKKSFIADHLSVYSDYALRPGMSIPDGLVWWTAFCFAFYVYADFSGYTDMARGLARILGFELSLNFQFPFLSKSPSEFWTRWHMSLSSWLRDYVYIPLGGNRLGILRQYLNLMTVWTLGGLWHGATYGYLIWGIYCGIQTVISHSVQLCWEKSGLPFRRNMYTDIIFILYTFFQFGLGLLLFRVENGSHLMYFIRNMGGVYFHGESFFRIMFFILPILITEYYQFRTGDIQLEETENSPKSTALSFVYLQLMFFIFCLFAAFEKKEFFYFQF
ncbi:MAG TPA: MBOAT family O-acyltransferase [Leptospiraceae bacterium]|nr:MBOAT family O-acyltransferase [Leptospiraceae bacterium]